MEELRAGEGDEVVSLVVDHDRGGRLASLRVAGHELLVGADEGIGHPFGWGAFPLVPWAGRIRHGRVEVGSGRGARTVQLPLAMPPHAIHGTTCDRAWTPVGPGSSRIDLGPDWPWPGQVTQVLDLSPRSLTWTLVVEGGSHADPMPATVGWHPWFRRRLDGPEGPVPVTLDVPAEAMWRRDHEGIPDGTLVSPPPPGPWDDCFTGLIGPVTLAWDGIGSLHVDADAEHVVVFDELDVGVCVEPQTGPPDAHRSGEDLAWVTPDEPLVATTTWTWRFGPS